MALTIKTKAQAGVNTFMCPICQEGNAALAKRGNKPQFFGTGFVQVTLERLGHLRAYATEENRHCVCHDRGHGFDVVLTA